VTDFIESISTALGRRNLKAFNGYLDSLRGQKQMISCESFEISHDLRVVDPASRLDREASDFFPLRDMERDEFFFPMRGRFGNILQATFFEPDDLFRLMKYIPVEV
jgi:hypothetical protein